MGALGHDLPPHLLEILEWDYIPWDFVRNRHGDLPHDPLVALLASYRWLGERLNLEDLASRKIPADGGGCQRCGSCCAYMRPGAVSASTYHRWLQRGALVARFYSPVRSLRKKNPPYNCWYNNEVRLRLCPFLMMNTVDRKPFCCIHHMGRDHRPGACSRFRPAPPSCQTTHIVIVP